MQTEGDFWRNTVKPQFDKMHFYYKRIESPLSPGVLDTVVLYKGQTTWIELKSKKLIEARYGLNPLQKIFYERWNLEGGYAYILTRIDTHVYLLKPTIVPTDPPTPEQLRKHTLISAPSREFPWEDLLSYLYRP